jgi:prophage regulatory protein
VEINTAVWQLRDTAKPRYSDKDGATPSPPVVLLAHRARRSRHLPCASLGAALYVHHYATRGLTGLCRLFVKSHRGSGKRAIRLLSPIPFDRPERHRGSRSLAFLDSGILATTSAVTEQVMSSSRWLEPRKGMIVHISPVPLPPVLPMPNAEGLTLPNTGFVRQKQLLRFVPFSKSTLWRRINAGEFPAPIRLSVGITAWRAEDVHRWIRAQSSSKLELAEQ